MHASDHGGLGTSPHIPERSDVREVEVAGGIVAQQIADGRHSHATERLRARTVHESSADGRTLMSKQPNDAVAPGVDRIGHGGLADRVVRHADGAGTRVCADDRTYHAVRYDLDVGPGSGEC